MSTTTTSNNILSSWQRTSTPAKAITSRITNRASPSVPSSAQTYEPSVKSVLRHRLTHIFLRSALFCWAINTVWTVWQLGGFSKVGFKGILLAPFQPLTLLSGVLLWFTSALPVIVLRKLYLTPHRTPAKSPRESLKAAVSKASTRSAFIVYIASAVSLTIIHVVMAHTLETGVRGDPKLSIFVKSKKHPRYLNGRLLFLLCSQITFATTFLFRNILRDRFVYRWPMPGVKPSSTLFESIVAAIISMISVSASLPLAVTFFAFARSLLPVLYQFPLLPILLRPFTAHFLKGPYTLILPFRHLSLFLRAWFLGFTTFFIWEWSEMFFENMVSEPIVILHSPSTLVSGITSTDLTMKFFAYSELHTFASDKSPSAIAQRTAFFGDQKNIPNLWSHFVRETLLLLGIDYQHFLRRGAPPLPPLSAAPKVATPSYQIPSTPTPLIRKSILRMTPQSPRDAILDSLASTSHLAQVVDAVPEFFRSTEEKVVVPVPAAKEGSVNTSKGWMDPVKDYANAALKKHAPVRVQEEVEKLVLWWREERVSRVVDVCLPSRELDVVVVGVLTHLVCASLTEDTYGVVQRDVPKILEALLSFLSAIEEYRVEVSARYTPPSQDETLSLKEIDAKEALRIEVERAGELLGYVGDGLTEGITRIVRTFGEKLTAFKFPPRTAQKLQGFLDYC